MQLEEAKLSLPERVVEATEVVRDALRAGLSEGCVTDLAFIGNASLVYEWVPCQMVDLDCFLFTPALDGCLGTWLEACRNQLSAKLEAADIDFEMRIVEGPYKPSATELERPVVVAHLGVFTEEMYQASAPLKRWAWRKYECEVEPARLRRLAPPQPTLEEFVYGRRGLLERKAAMETGRVEMVEWTLPELGSHTFFIDCDSAAFQECCFAYATNCSRNHARALGRLEADTLGNELYFKWYLTQVFDFEPLAELFLMKARSRNEGFVHNTDRVHEITLGYLRALAAHLK